MQTQVWGKVMFLHLPVCSQVGVYLQEGMLPGGGGILHPGFCLQGGLHPVGSAYGVSTYTLKERLEKQVVCILLECFILSLKV